MRNEEIYELAQEMVYEAQNRFGVGTNIELRQHEEFDHNSVGALALKILEDSKNGVEIEKGSIEEEVTKDVLINCVETADINAIEFSIDKNTIATGYNNAIEHKKENFLLANKYPGIKLANQDKEQDIELH